MRQCFHFHRMFSSFDYVTSFYSELQIFLYCRMMDTGKKKMLTLKKVDRDRKKLNETILKRLKTLDADSSGASIM